MVSLVNHQNAITTSSSRFHDSFLFECRPKMLKDFLNEDCFHSHSSSSSSNGFSVYPRKKSTVPIPSKSNQTSMVLLRSQSKKVATTTILAIHKVINVVKFFPFASAKSPLAFHKRFTRKLMFNNKKSYKGMGDISTKNTTNFKIKDILRWDSFRDLVAEKSTLEDFSSSPNRCTTTSATITTTTTTTSCSRRSSWCDSDFTSEDLPHICGESEEFWGNKFLLGHHEVDATLTNPKGGWAIEESEQQSPVSVLESTFHESEGYVSPFRPILANFRSTILEQEEEEEELNETVEHAMLLLSNVKESMATNTKNMNPLISYDVILNYFILELSTNGKSRDVDFDREISRTAKSWLNGQFDECYEWKLHDKREAYVKDMEKGVGWKVFKQEQQEICKALEINVLNELIDEILDDLFDN